MLQDKVKQAKDVLQLGAELSEFYYQKPLIVTYSGGKDSDVMLDIAKKCLQPEQFEVMYHLTTVDAPETYYHVKKVFADLEKMGIHTEIRMPMYKGKRTSMWKLIEDKMMPPTRVVRYCCKVLKESSTPNRMVAVGVRESESTGRKGRDSFAVRAQRKQDAQFFGADHIREQWQASKQASKQFDLRDDEENVYDCKFIASIKKHKDTICNPIYKFTDADIWEYVRENDIEMNPLYAKGYKRVGCIGCPMAGARQQKKEFADYPIYKLNYIRAFDRMAKKNKERACGNKLGLETGEEWYRWWIGENPNQVTFDDLIDNDEENII